MKTSESFRKTTVGPLVSVIIALLVLGSVLANRVYCEDLSTSAAQRVDELLGQIDGGNKREASEKLYGMGPEIDILFLQKLAEIDIAKMNDPYSMSGVIVTILSSRGYEKEVFDILKSRLYSKNPSDRASAATIISLNYRYLAIRDLADIIPGKKDPGYLSERVMYEWNATSAEIVEQILEVMQGKSDEARRFVIYILKAYGLHCPECGYDTEKWKTFFDKKSDYVKFLGSDWLDSAGRSGPGVAGVRDIASDPDGTKIAFVWGYNSEDRYKTDLCILDTSTNRMTKVQYSGNCYRPSWSPAGDRILFQYTDSNGFSIGTVRADGSEVCLWTKSFHSFNQKSRDGWSRNSSKIAYVRNWTLPSAYEIWTTDLSKNKGKRVVKDAFCERMPFRLHPTWFLSKDDKIFFWNCRQDEESSAGLYSVPLDTPERVELFQALDLDRGFNSMTPSPDETKLAYTRDSCSLFIYDFGAKETKEYEVGSDSYCVWTPDGRRILYSVFIGNGRHEVRILCLDTGESTKLAIDSLDGSAFGPGGNSIYYIRRDEQTNASSIRRVSFDGTNDIQVFPAEGIEEESIRAVPILKWAEGSQEQDHADMGKLGIEQ